MSGPTHYHAPSGAGPGTSGASDEYRRLRTLLRYAITQAPSPNLDRLARLASRTFGTTIAFVSPMASDHQWFKAVTGLPDTRPVDRETSFCKHVVDRNQPLVIRDTLEHEAYRDHPAVVESPRIRFYAGAPLISDDGYALGTFCVAGPEPRDFDDDDLETLRDFAALAVSELEYQRRAHEIDDVKKLARLGHWLYDVHGSQVSWDPQACRLLGWSDRIGHSHFNDLIQCIHPDDQPALLNAVGETLAARQRQHVRFRVPVTQGDERTLEAATSAEWTGNDEIPLVLGTLQDVTELAAAEAALSGSEARYRSLVEDHPNFVQRFELDTTVVFTNSALAEFRGAAPGDLVGRPWLGMVPPDDRLPVLEFLERFTPDEPTGSIEIRCTRSDGEVRWTQWTYRAFFDTGGRVESFQAVGLDINDRKQAEAALAENERLLRESYEQLDKLADNAPGFLFQLRRTPEGSYQFPYVSHGIRELFGVSRETAQRDGGTALGRIHPQEQDHIHGTLQASAHWLTVWQEVFRVCPRDGDVVWVEGNSTPEALEDGSVLWHGSVRDVTDRKRAWDALYESEERFRQLAERIEEVFWLRTPERMLYINPAYERIWGRSVEALYLDPEDAAHAVHPDDRDRVRTAQRRHHEYGAPFDETYRIFRENDGTERWIRARSYIIDGETLRTAGTATDVTAIKQYEDELKRLAATDRLTGLWNRVHFDGEMQRALERLRRYGAPSTLVLFDLDHFKSVNDEHGHIAGDAILRGVAEQVQSMLRATDMLARWGGEEFAMLLPDTGEEPAFHLAERMRERLASMDTEVNLPITVSCGLTELRADDAPDDPVLRADEALYRAKRQGRNRTERG